MLQENEMTIVTKSDIEFWNIFKICKPTIQDMFHAATVNSDLYKGVHSVGSF